MFTCRTLGSAPVVMNSSIFWDRTPGSLLEMDRCFLGRSGFHLQGLKLRQVRNQREVDSKQNFAPCLLKARSLLGLALFSNPEDGDDIYKRNVCRLSMDFTAIYPG
jgi:hypothetical protein